MNRTATRNDNFSRLSPEEERTLETLLGDEDPNTYQALEKLILRDAERYIDWLKRCRLSDNPLVRRHAGQLVSKHLAMTSKVRFLIFCHTQPENLDLEQGLFALARTEYPEINADGYKAILDEYAAELDERIRDSEDPYEILEHLNTYLFDDLGYEGNQQNYYAPDNNYINKVIDTRVGNPVGLCCLYWLLGQRLGQPITGIGMPGHFLIRFQNNREEIYIDPYNQGRILSRKDCMRMAVALGLEFHYSLLTPTTSRSTLIRICTNLSSAYRKTGHTEKALRSDLFINYLNRRINSTATMDF